MVRNSQGVCARLARHKNKKNLPTNFDQPVPQSLATPLRSLQMEYRKWHQTTASLRVQNTADSEGQTSAALPSVAASD